MDRTNEITVLIERFARLPGLGPKSAQRLVLHLIRNRERLVHPLADSLRAFAENVRDCQQCGNATTEPVCSVCADPEREADRICVVETVADLWAIERTHVYKGRYFVLGGVLSVRDGTTPEQLRIPQLVARVAEGRTREVILALNATVDGQTTIHFIASQLDGADVAISILGRGVPIGGELDYLDGGTITAAMMGRRAY